MITDSVRDGGLILEKLDIDLKDKITFVPEDELRATNELTLRRRIRYGHAHSLHPHHLPVTSLEAGDMETPSAVLQLPTEIWREIVSDSNFLILGSEKDGIPRSLLLLGREKITSCPKTVPPAYRERPEALRALSQTCRALRAIFFPLLWEYVEACFESKNGRTAWHASVANVLLKRCTALVKPENMAIARHVRVVSVSLSWHKIAVAAPLFAQCLEALPNLDTLHILYLKSKWQGTINTAFEDKELPGVRTIILPSGAHGILAACPNVRDVSCNEESGAKLFDTLIGCCPEVERIQGFQLTTAKLKKLSKHLRNLREIAIPFDADIDSLSVIKRLSKIELLARKSDDDDESEIDDGDDSAGMALHETKHERINAARTVLKSSAGEDPKRIKISYWADIVGMLGMAEITYGKYWVMTEEFDA
ncbi:hypothetical protein C8F04DRAFT_1249414 [Mycena alexandri]|uniref:F-box domain-containing protein n=1 Tax=Mycena alexandri TaxID=1745969 RepID=A0AAD6TFC0_9AGAR|nr:hypothetical protein C8F04DRAFT_1249414 [Mycena alexandri]